MAYSIRGLFGVSALVAIFMAAIYSRSDLAVSLATLAFVLLVIIGAALAFVSKGSANFWRAFAVIAIGTIFLSPQIDLFDHTAGWISYKLRPPVVYMMSANGTWVSSNSGPPSSVVTANASSFTIYSAPSLPPALSAPSPSVSSPASYSQPVAVAPSPVYLPANSMGYQNVQSLQKLLVVSFALFFGLIAAVIIDVGLARAKRRELPAEPSGQ